MKDPKHTYQARLEHLSRAADRQKRRLRGSSLLRMLVFTLVVFLAYHALQGSPWYGVGAILAAGVFVYLVSRHQDLRYEAARLHELIRINQTELEVLRGNFGNLPDGEAYQDAGHAFSGDLDLFGPGSFFQYLNRTGLSSGADTLAQWLSSNDVSGIPEKQEAVRELSEPLGWRQDYTATARLIATPVSIGDLKGWMQEYSPKIPGWAKPLSLGFSMISLAVGLLTGIGALPVGVLVGLFFLGLALTFPYTRHVGSLASRTGKMQEAFRQYGLLVSQIEGRHFEAEKLKELKNGLKADVPVSTILKRFNRLIGALDQRNNLLVAIFGNAFFLWDLRQAWAVEQWIRTYGERTPLWFEALSGFDASNSLANFAFNHPGYTYPEISKDENHTLKARELAHPLLKGKVVPNDVQLERGHFMVITGANMAGKSTFLRAVSLGMLMANTGLPVCASAMAYTPMPLITSMRTTDSLSRQESYFFAELKRLKMVVEHLESGPYFVILDEILKGTNSRDKARGSKEFLLRLLNLKATGLIATHDLSLCEVADAQPEVHNYFFDVEIREDALFFDYRLKAGVCSNMNASYLLRKLGLVGE